MLESIESVTYNGINLDEEFNNTEAPNAFFFVEAVRGRETPIEELSLISVIGMDGRYFRGLKTRHRELEIDIAIKGVSFEDLRRRIERLSEILSVKDPVPINFSDEPQRTYYGIYQGYSLGEERSKVIKLTLNITCPDPYKYGPEESFSISDTSIVENNGTAEADPIFTFDVQEPTTFAMISNGEEYMMVGQPYDVAQDTPYERYEQIFYSDASSIVGWTSGTSVDGGVVAGEMRSNGTRFEAASYGSGSQWHGPAIRRSLPEVVSDFRFEAFIGYFNRNVAAYVGRVEIYLLDTVGNVVAKLAIKDTQNSQALAFAEVRAGDASNNHFLINEYGDRPGNWNQFSGIMRVEREGNRWHAYVAMVDAATGRHHTRRSVRWTDTSNQFTRNVAQVQVHVGKFGSHQTTAGGVYSMRLDKINQESNGIPYIANAGDEIVFDHNTGDVYINGEPVPFDMGADFFKLKKGGNGLAVLPEETFETDVKFRERYR